MGLWFDFPSRCFPSLAGTGRGSRGPQLLVLKTREGFIVCPSPQRKNGKWSLFRRPWALELEPKHGVGDVCPASQCGHLPEVWH